MVRAVEDVSGPGTHVLVALSLNLDISGRYLIQSVYPIGYATVRRRLRTGHLIYVLKTPKAPHAAGPQLKA
jgi:hypothetical protein